jgi:hypothetical protein
MIKPPDERDDLPVAINQGVALPEDKRLAQLSETNQGAYDMLTQDEREFTDAIALVITEPDMTVEKLIKNGSIPAYAYEVLKDEFDALFPRLAAFSGAIQASLGNQDVITAMEGQIKDQIAGFFIRNGEKMMIIQLVKSNESLFVKVLAGLINNPAGGQENMSLQDIVDGLNMRSDLILNTANSKGVFRIALARECAKALKEKGVEAEWQEGTGQIKCKGSYMDIESKGFKWGQALGIKATVSLKHVLNKEELYEIEIYGDGF